MNYTNTNKDKCYVLALEGGGDKGAYQAGALKGLVLNVKDGETQWDVVTGISVGSLNAAGISIFDIGNETAAVDYLIGKWKNIKGNHDIFYNWWFGPLEGLFFKSGLYDTTPLRKMLIDIIAGNDLKRKIVIGATSLENGTLETWDEETLFRNEYVEAILSSSAYPVIFPNIKFRGNSYMDGGVKVGVNIPSGINKCLDMGYSEEKIVVDVILLSSKVLPRVDISHISPLESLIRVFEISGYDNTMEDLDFSKKEFPKAQFRYVIAPTQKLPSGKVPLTFKPEEIDEMINIGMEDAKNIVEMGEGQNLKNLIDEFYNEKHRVYGRKKKN